MKTSGSVVSVRLNMSAQPERLGAPGLGQWPYFSRMTAIRPLHPMGNGRPERLTWRERFAAMRYVPALLTLVWQTDRLLTLATAVLRIVRAFVPVATLWIGKLIIDEVIHDRATGPNWTRLGL